MLQARDGVREVEAQLEHYIEQLHQRIPYRAIVVTGSRARNDHFTDSDIDLVVVSEAFEKLNRGERIELLLQDWHDSPALEPLGYTAHELLLGRGLYVWDAMADGRVLHDDGMWRQACQAFDRERMDGRLVRTARGWREF